MDALLSSLKDLGVARVLSSGGAATARGGRSTLWALNKACARRGLEVTVAGTGVACFLDGRRAAAFDFESLSSTGVGRQPIHNTQNRRAA